MSEPNRESVSRTTRVVLGVGWFAIGHLAGLLWAFVLWGVWFDFRWSAAGLEWLFGVGLGRLVGFWSRAPYFLEAALLGVAVGLAPRKLSPRRLWLLFSLCAGMGLVTCSAVWMTATGFGHLLFDVETWGWRVVLWVHAANASALAFAIAAAAIVTRMRTQRERGRGFEVPSPRPSQPSGG